MGFALIVILMIQPDHIEMKCHFDEILIIGCTGSCYFISVYHSFDSSVVGICAQLWPDQAITF